MISAFFMHGISGLLYKNTELLFDTKTETLWSQLNGKALVGSLIGAQLDKYPFQILSFQEAQKDFPQVQYLSFDTGYLRDYSLDPFKDYALNEKQIVESISNYSDKLKYKDLVLGFTYDSKDYAVAVTSISDNAQIIYKSSSTQFMVTKTTGSYEVKDIKGKSIDYDELYWFVWYDSKPDTILIQPVS